MGTTDTFHRQPAYWPEIVRDDVEYLLAACEGAFSVEPLTHDDVLAMWSGVRPLLAEKGKKPSEISRRHEIFDGPGGVVTVAGGKLTAYRSMAGRVVDRCEEKLGRKPTASRTADEPLPGGDLAEPLERLSARAEGFGLEAVDAERAVMLYGSEVLGLLGDGVGPAAEAEFSVKVEGALMLEDFWVRRSARANFDPDGGMAALEPAADRMARLLGWSDDERDRQIETCRRRRRRLMNVLKSETSARETGETR
jgi:glycerol-3-phosphate dehydrogenase